MKIVQTPTSTVPWSGFRRRQKSPKSFVTLFQDLRETLSVVTGTKVRKSLLITLSSGSSSGDVIEMTRSFLSAADRSSFFYLANYGANNATGAGAEWFQVLTLLGQDKVIVNPLRFAEGGSNAFCVMEQYDLQGLDVISRSLSWQGIQFKA